MRVTAMKTQNRDIVIRRLDERRYGLAVDGIVRYVGSEEECQRRLAMLAPKKDGPTRIRRWRGSGGYCADG